MGNTPVQSPAKLHNHCNGFDISNEVSLDGQDSDQSTSDIIAVKEQVDGNVDEFIKKDGERLSIVTGRQNVAGDFLRHDMK